MKRLILSVALLGSVWVSASNDRSEIVLPFENYVVLESYVTENTFVVVSAYAVSVIGLDHLAYFNTLACANNFINQDPGNRAHAGKYDVPESWVITCL